MKICRICGEGKSEIDFPFRDKKKGIRRTECSTCISLYNKQYRKENENYITQRRKKFYEDNKDRLLDEAKRYQQNNKKSISQSKKDYYSANKEKSRIYQQQNRKRLNDYMVIRRKNDPLVRLRENVSASVYRLIKSVGYSKSEKSVINFLPYSFQELKEHIEKQFEPWMTWENYGRYDINIWDDNDPTTWTWQIDHIIPQTQLPYVSMKDDNFQKCWALPNLRPYSAKMNIKDGNRR